MTLAGVGDIFLPYRALRKSTPACNICVSPPPFCCVSFCC
nr:MAG TPA: hypothetical protein [Caudoviricetes sp.]